MSKKKSGTMNGSVRDEKAFILYSRYYYDQICNKASRKTLSQLYPKEPYKYMPREEILKTAEYKKEFRKNLNLNSFAAAFRAGHPESSEVFVKDYLEKAPILRKLAEGKHITASRMMKKYEEARKQEKADAERDILRKNILNRIPDRLPDLYPAARAMKRSFILHVGPTNSGKTYDAIEAMKNADTGIYLGPLRLLAYEQYQKLNREDVPCDLVTGEEEALVDFARHRASTVEMLPLDIEYDCAVIDEAQMVSDSERGGAWTAAILGVCAAEIHVCLAPEAEECVIRMIEDCGDSWQVVRHERKTPLVLDDRDFRFPKDVEEGDALIVFSRKDVHAVASVLQSKGKKCSVIYGNLPHDVRHSQADDFMRGVSDVVVATDAIGMGMNLPIRRVVFLENKKFDGKEERFLYDYEVKQIAGRAGRYGIHEVGLYNTLYSRLELEKKILSENRKIQKAYVDFPQNLRFVGTKLSETMRQWNSISMGEGYKRGAIEREIALAEIAEKYTEDRDLIYRFATIPFDEKDGTLMQMWHDMLLSRINGGIYIFTKIHVHEVTGSYSDDLRVLEHQYKMCDMLFYYKKRFEPERFGWIEAKKAEISGRIIEILNKQELSQKRCIACGRKLPWNYRYTICERCHSGRPLYW